MLPLLLAMPTLLSNPQRLLSTSPRPPACVFGLLDTVHSAVTKAWPSITDSFRSVSVVKRPSLFKISMTDYNLIHRLGLNFGHICLFKVCPSGTWYMPVGYVFSNIFKMNSVYILFVSLKTIFHNMAHL